MIRHIATTVVASIVVVACTAAIARAGDPNGTWKWSITTQGGQEFQLSVALKADGEQLTGTLTLPMGDNVDIKEGSFKNDEVSFTTEVEFGGNVVKTKYKGKVEGDTIKGKSSRERDGQVRERDWEAKRQK